MKKSLLIFLYIGATTLNGCNSRASGYTTTPNNNTTVVANIGVNLKNFIGLQANKVIIKPDDNQTSNWKVFPSQMP